MKKFDQLTLKGQKMRIVRDAIKQIQEKVIIPRTRHYFFIPSHILWGKSTPVRQSLQKILASKDAPNCEACAKGSLFAACVLNVNKVFISASAGMNQLNDERLHKQKLKKWFSQGELDTIETAFEEKVVVDSTDILRINNDWFEHENLTVLGKRAVKFGRRFKSSKNRLLAILKNILKNGTFKP
jgi:hypothetical protein